MTDTSPLPHALSDATADAPDGSAGDGCACSPTSAGSSNAVSTATSGGSPRGASRLAGATTAAMARANPSKLTPMFEQYLRIKEDHPDALLLYRMGDFYEMFFDDAETAARELQIALTCRNPNADLRVPMCGVPHHSVEGYITQLLEKGFKVALCDQIEDPREAKGLVKRAVTRVLTPGTVVEDANLDAKGHNYLGALYWDDEKEAGGFAWLDFSTGDWSGLHAKKSADLWQWVRKMQPRELLVPEGAQVPASMSLTSTQVVRVPGRAPFDLKAATERLLHAQNVRDTGALGLEGKDELVRACGALLAYIVQTQKQDLIHLAPFRPLNLGRHLIVDEVTERNLEIFRRLDGRKGQGTLWHVLDHTETPMGGRLLEERLRHPWREMSPIEETQAAVTWLFERDDTRRNLRAALNEVYDLERLTTRIFLNRAAPKDYVALRQSLAALPKVRGVLERPEVAPGNYPTDGDARGEGQPPFLRAALKGWDDLSDYFDLLERALVDSPPHLVTEGGLFRPGFHAELDELLDLTEHGENLLQQLLAEEQTASGLPKLKLGFNRVFGYYFELSRSASDTVPEHFVRRQTLANAERFTTPRLKELEEKLVSASDRRKSLEYKLFQKLRETVSEARPRVLFMADLLAGFDYWQSLAETARRWNWTRPVLSQDTDILIREGRHPVVEAMQGSANFIPNDLRMDDARRLLLITGPNMAGKSTVLRQTAIICLLAQMGSFVPAREARLGIADRVFSRVGASDNLAQGQSTFMVEMMETARILRQASKRSLVILDEIGRGTSTFDGLALAWAVVEELARRAGGTIRTLFATHYHELTALEGRIPGVHNMNIAIREWGGEIVFLRRLVPGPSDRSYGIEVARLAGVPQPVVQRARELLHELEKTRDGRGDAPRAARAVLPGLDMPEPKQAAKPRVMPSALGGQAMPVAHPLLTTLRDLDTDHLTPMGALQLLNEWKLLWGGPAHAEDTVPDQPPAAPGDDND